MELLSYQDILNQLRENNPNLSLREAQIKASGIYKEQREALAKASQEAIPPSPKKSIYNPDQIEEAIRSAGVNKHSIIRISHNFSTDFIMKIAGKDGVNSLVYLDGPCRVPAKGFFKIWL